MIDLNSTLIIMSSKSGNTVEQMATFLILRDKLIDTVGAVRAKEQILTITDVQKGTLRQITDLEGYRSMSMPGDVGGRYSVLSVAGLLPLACAGVKIERLLEGARDFDMLDERGIEDASDNYAGVSPAAQYAYHQYLAYERHQMHQSVLFTYNYKMREIGSWYRQLWAESLGKRLNRLEEEVNIGPTPISSVGPTDQHSQCQLYMEGPADKIFTFVRVKNVARDIVLPDAYPDLEGVSYLKGINLNKILLAEQEATAEALARAGRPSVVLELSELDPYSLGQLLYFFELAAVYAGSLWNIDPFDQPGVELGKKLMYQKLGRKGFEKVA
jgi:glucose-6-phosphate isomerase